MALDAPSLSLGRAPTVLPPATLPILLTPPKTLSCFSPSTPPWLSAMTRDARYSPPEGPRIQVRRQVHFWGGCSLNRMGSEQQEREREDSSMGRPGWGSWAFSWEWSRSQRSPCGKVAGVGGTKPHKMCLPLVGPQGRKGQPGWESGQGRLETNAGGSKTKAGVWISSFVSWFINLLSQCLQSLCSTPGPWMPPTGKFIVYQVLVPWREDRRTVGQRAEWGDAVLNGWAGRAVEEGLGALGTLLGRRPLGKYGRF